MEQTLPRRIFFRQGERNGNGWSWSVSVYVLNWEHPNEIYPQADDIPLDGNPHPLHVPPNLEEGGQVEGLVNEL
jgi:hypothetical protein